MADAFLYEKLSGDATLTGLVGSRIYADVAPKVATYPFILFSLVNGTPTRGVGPAVIWFDELWQVAAVDDGRGYETCGEIIDRVRAVLDASSGTLDDGTVVACMEVGYFRFSAVEHGVVYKTLGLEFRVFSQ